MSIDGETVNIDVSGKCDSNEKSIIEHRLCEALHLHVYPELAVNIFDKQDRLNRREKSRKELEDEIRESV